MTQEGMSKYFIKKKVCFLIPSLGVGGMERVMSVILKYLSSKNDLEIYLILYGRPNPNFYHLPENITVISQIKFNNKLRFFYSFQRLLYLRNLIKKISPHSILSFGEYWNNFVLISLHNLVYPIYISDRCQPSKRLVKFHNILRRLLYPNSKGIILQTKTAKNIYKKEFPLTPIHVIQNPIDIDLFQQQAKQENIILSVGRLIKTKNHDLLIKLFAEINNPEWKLLIIGDDAVKQQNRTKLELLINELGLKNRVSILGFQKDLQLFYLKSKIFAFTSSSEGFPNVIGEAMASGLPVISYDCESGPSEMITDGVDGFLIPVFHDQLFKMKLEQLMGNENLRVQMGLNARESIKRFSINIIGEKYYSLLSSSFNNQSFSDK